MSYDLMYLYVTLEAMSLMMAVLIGLEYKEYSAEAAVKYYVMSCFGMAVLVMGVTQLAGQSGLSGFSQLSEYFAEGLGGYSHA